MITYKEVDKHICVYLDGRYLGIIKRAPNGYGFFLVGQNIAGEILPTIEDIKRTLESM